MIFYRSLGHHAQAGDILGGLAYPLEAQQVGYSVAILDAAAGEDSMVLVTSSLIRETQECAGAKVRGNRKPTELFLTGLGDWGSEINRRLI
jgi:hypothetical protein